MVIEAHLNPTQLAGLIAFLVAGLSAAGVVLRTDLRPDSGAQVWTLVAVAQAAFAVEVVLGGRHRIHDLVNTVLRDNGIYALHEAVQAVLLVLCAVVIVLWVEATQRWMNKLARLTRHARRAAFATLALGALFLVESVSLHAIDQLLYASVGPVRAIAYLWGCAALAVTSSAWAELYRK